MIPGFRELAGAADRNAASEAYDENNDVMLMPHPDVSASSSRAVNSVVAGYLSLRVIVQVPVLQTPDTLASTTAAIPKRPNDLM